MECYFILELNDRLIFEVVDIFISWIFHLENYAKLFRLNII